MMPEPFHRIAGQPVPLGVEVVRGRPRSMVVDDRVHEELTAKPRAALVAQTQRGSGGEHTSSAVTCDNDARGATTQLRRVLRHPPRCDRAIIDPTTEFLPARPRLLAQHNHALTP